MKYEVKVSGGKMVLLDGGCVRLTEGSPTPYAQSFYQEIADALNFRDHWLEERSKAAAAETLAEYKRLVGQE